MVVTSALKSFDMNQEMVARSLGASRPRAFLLVTLPQIRFAVVSGALLSFLTSFDEVILALFVSGGANSTLTRNMFNALRDQIDPTIAAISTIMILVTSMLLAAAQLAAASPRRNCRSSTPASTSTPASISLGTDAAEAQHEPARRDRRDREAADRRHRDPRARPRPDHRDLGQPGAR